MTVCHRPHVPALLAWLLIAVPVLAEVNPGYVPPANVAQPHEGDPRLLPPGCQPGPGEVPDPWLHGVYHHVKPKHDPACRERLPDYVWPHPEAPRPKFPDPPPQDHGLDLAHADEATAEKYFNWLCDKEAGIWNYKYAEVDAVIDLRGRRGFERYAGWMMKDRYYLDNPLALLMAASAHAPALPFASERSTRKKDDWRRWVYRGKGIIIDEIAVVDPVLRDRPYRTDKPYARWELFIPDGAVIEKGQPWWSPRARPDDPPSETVTYVALSPKRISELIFADLGTRIAPEYSSIGPKEIAKLRAGEICCTATYRLPSRLTYTDQPIARYGYFSREIQRSPHDRRLGIAGTEFVVVDTHTGDILALSRMFGRPGARPLDDRHVNWFAPQICPNYRSSRGGSSDWQYSKSISSMLFHALRPEKPNDLETYVQEQREQRP